MTASANASQPEVTDYKEENESVMTRNYPKTTGDFLFFGDNSTIVRSVGMLPTLSDSARFILSRLEQFKDLQPNYDGHNAIPPHTENLLKAKTYTRLADLMHLPLYFVAPGPNGEICLEFKQENKSAEIYFNVEEGVEIILYDGLEQNILESNIHQDWLFELRHFFS